MRETKINGDQSLFMCSYDIKSLFTNIPLQETIEICVKSLYDDADIKTPPFSRSVFKKLLEFSMCNLQFSFNDVMYQQDNGCGMGNLLSSILSNIYVGFHEEKIFSKKEVYSPTIYYRYVDDTFATFETLADSKTFLDRLNSLHPALQFTCELEKDNKLPFLDVLVKKENGHLITTVYRKPTFTGQYQRWDSSCAEKMKRTLISLLVHR